MNYIEIDAGKAFGIKALNGAVLMGMQGTDTHPLMPKEIAGYIFRDHLLRRLMRAWKREHSRADTDPRRGIYAIGPKGAGKTTVFGQFFARLGVPVVEMTWGKRMTVGEAVQDKALIDGDIVAVDGPILTAMKFGIPLVINELDYGQPGELGALNDIIERGIVVLEGGEVVHAKRGFVVYATGNTGGLGDEEGTYAGTNNLNEAFLSRFFKIQVDYPTPEEETAIVMGRYPTLAQELVEKLVQIAGQIRSAYAGTIDGLRLSQTFSVRETLAWADSAAYYAPWAAAKKTSATREGLLEVFADGLPEAERLAVLKLHDAVIG